MLPLCGPDDIGLGAYDRTAPITADGVETLLHLLEQQKRYLCAERFGLLKLEFGPAHPGELLSEMVEVPAGHLSMRSDRDEREYAYRLDEKVSGHSRTREWEWYES